MKQVIIGSTGLDSAFAAAMLLTRFPDANVQQCHGPQISRRLEQILAGGTYPENLLICNVDVEVGSPDFGKLTELLLPCRNSGCHVAWFCSPAIPASRSGALKEIVDEVHIGEDVSATALVQRRFDIPLNDHLTFLLRMSDAFFRGRVTVERDWIDWIALTEQQNDDAIRKGGQFAFRDLLGILIEPDLFTPMRRDIVRDYCAHRFIYRGESVTTRELLATIMLVSKSHEPILMMGESGTGRELISWEIHKNSPRSEKVFYPLNCSIISSSDMLANDILFGHDRSLFGSGEDRRLGAFRTAEGGTIYLDEISELSLPMQSLFLRLLRERQIRPLGSDSLIPVNVRIIAATNRDLEHLVTLGLFRKDLLHLLKVLPVSAPSFADWSEDDMRKDLTGIARSINQEFLLNSPEIRQVELDESDWRAILAYSWPGNIRQFRVLFKRSAIFQQSMAKILENEIKHSSKQMNQGMETISALPADWPHSKKDVHSLETIKRHYAERVLDLHEGNYRKAATALDLSYNGLRNLLRSRDGAAK